MKISKRHKNSVSFVSFVMLVVLLAASSAPADFRIGFYNDFALVRHLTSMAELGATVNLPYNGGTNTGVATRYTDASYANKQAVIAGIPADYVKYGLTSQISIIVSAFGGHPGTIGYYTADEPASNGISVAQCETAYNAIKAISNKPVFICLMNSEIEGGAASDYQNAYDVLLADSYECVVGSAEFAGLEGGNGWKQDMQEAKTAAEALGKPWWSILQAIGEVDGYDWTYRLPTASENRFMYIWSILEGADSILYWAYYRTIQTEANASCPYAADGKQWLVDVWEPGAFEINTYASAISNGAVSGAVSDNMADITAKVYQDPVTGDYYLISLNYETGAETPTFMLNLPITITSAQRMFESGSVAVSAGSFSDSFAGYQAHVYKLSE